MLISLIYFFVMPFATGQKYYTKTGRVTFVSQAPMEKIVSTNTNALMVVDAATGNAECSVLIKGFQFDKALMQEHFNENYMESHKFPKALFKGLITNIREIDFKKDGTYNANVKGELTMHGVTQPVTMTSKIVVKSGNVAATTSFEIKVSDFSIVIPKVVSDKVAEKVGITVSADLQLMP